jgi:NAD-dependent dihydropyrimidine dehydrogenase PreA subunit
VQTVFTATRPASSATPASTSARWTASPSPTNGDEADLRTRLKAPALNLTQDLYVRPLKTGRVMVKDEDVCLHCGLCAERCPTGAWDMQKFLLNTTKAGPRRTAGPRPPLCQAGGRMKRIEATNDFVIKFANVNGSGSASANELFAKAILRMGVPVSPRNIFPSNIQGLPTWYEVRVTERGYLGRRGGIDMMVAMNPQTWDADVAEIEPGGYLFYDSTRAAAAQRLPRRHHTSSACR